LKFYLVSLYRNLLAGARLALFMRVRPYDYRVTPLDLSFLLAFNFAVLVGTAAIHARLEGEFNVAVVPVYLASVALLLGTAMVIAGAYRLHERLLLVATALSASEPVFGLIGLAVPALALTSGMPRVVVFTLLGWMWLISVRAVTVCMGTKRPQVLIGALAVTAMVALAYSPPWRVDVWQLPPEEDEPAPLADERTFHLQGHLIEQALARVAKGREGVRELYFVGFAPDASQDVFVKEMRYVKKLFEERFGTSGRSIALVNSQDALEEFPIASVTNLSRALERVARSMNGDEDTLFLFLSAHGYPDHRLSAVQPPLELAPLTPTALSRMLHEAGIKWRVIVVSACYSGGFIEPLKDANSVVITASAPDRTSFGCEPGRDFTYFGQAYFRDALAQTRSFTRAFEAARAGVEKMEAVEGVAPPSNPQMWVGAAMAERLKQAADAPQKE
jgi:hypothetical protein